MQGANTTMPWYQTVALISLLASKIALASFLCSHIFMRSKIIPPYSNPPKFVLQPNHENI